MTDTPVSEAAVAAVATAVGVAPADSATAALVAAPTPEVLAQPAVAAVVDAAKDIATKDQELADLHARFDHLESVMNAIAEKTGIAAPAVSVQSTGEVLVQTKGPCGAIRAFNASVRASKCFGNFIAWGYKALEGSKTLIVFGVTGGIALAQELQAIDITPYVQAFLPAGATVTPSQIVIFMSVAGILLRVISKTPLFAKWASGSGAAGGSDSKVDEPAGTVAQ